MSLFVYNPLRISEELTPPQLRRPAFINWLRVLLRPIKWLADNFNNDYVKGSSAPDYNNATTYTKYDRVVWKDFGVYELRVSTSSGVSPTGDYLSPTNWYKIQDNFLGVNERARTNGQLIVLAYIMNKQFRVTSAPYIYFQIVNTPPAQYFQVYVPLATYNALGANNTARTNRINNYIIKYLASGSLLNVSSY